MRRILLAVTMVVATTVLAVPAASAGPATAQCEAGVKVSATESPETVSVTDTRTGEPVEVVVTITGTNFTITAPQTTPPVDYTVEDASWCLKAATRTDPVAGTGPEGDSPVVNKKGITQNIGYVTLFSVTTVLSFDTSCYSTADTRPDLQLNKPLGELRNLTRFYSADGSCVDPILDGAPRTVVDAADQDAANDTCANLGLALNSLNLRSVGYNTPSNWWACL